MKELEHSLEIRALTPELCPAILNMLKAVEAAGDGGFFTPHPFTPEAIALIAARPGLDFYSLLMCGPRALAYGILRGWNEGYSVPSLGLAVAPEFRGKGYGRLMMQYLHAVARQRGAARVRLRVHFENTGALRLYRSLGYVFEAPAAGSPFLVGWGEAVTG